MMYSGMKWGTCRNSHLVHFVTFNVINVFTKENFFVLRHLLTLAMMTTMSLFSYTTKKTINFSLLTRKNHSVKAFPSCVSLSFFQIVIIPKGIKKIEKQKKIWGNPDDLGFMYITVKNHKA